MTLRASPGPTVVALGVIGGGIAVVWSAAAIPVSPAYSRIGPTLFPELIGAALVLLGIALLSSALTGRWACEATDPDEPNPDLGPLLWVGAGLLLNLLLIKNLGFILSSTLMFVLVARGFGARRIWVSALIGFALALVAYFGFAQLLGLRMGGGVIEDLI